jgi:hypothetical protein
VRVDRAGGGEVTTELAPAECGKDVGPFWVSAVAGHLVAAWAEHVPKRDATSAPIAGLAYRVFDGPTPGPMTRVPLPADALVDAGCDKEKCYAVALVRAPGTTNMRPEAVRAIAYP